LEGDNLFFHELDPIGLFARVDLVLAEFEKHCSELSWGPMCAGPVAHWRAA
jgi:hypothetical protein